jgi:hypothetical protein
MQKYEYLVVDAGASGVDSTHILNQYAAEGYRLVGTEMSMGFTMRYILERAVTKPPQGSANASG